MVKEELRFVCDRMLGGLSKWLRLLGFDVLYPEDIEDEKIDELARRENRILLTRDRNFSRRAKSSVLLLYSLDTEEQLKEVDGCYEILKTSEENGSLFTRCSVCNYRLVDASKDEVKGNVPPGVYEHQEVYWFCPGCGRYYWPGTHYGEILKKIETLK